MQGAGEVDPFLKIPTHTHTHTHTHTGEIDPFLKIPRPDGQPDKLGLTMLDEPAAVQTDPTVLDLQLRAISTQV